MAASREAGEVSSQAAAEVARIPWSGSRQGWGRDPWHSQAPGLGVRSSEFLQPRRVESHSYWCPDGVLVHVSGPVVWGAPGPSQGRSCYDPQPSSMHTHYISLDIAPDIAALADSNTTWHRQRCPNSPRCSGSVPWRLARLTSQL